MSAIIYGLYEQIINGIINENLTKVDQELVIQDTQPLDSAESSQNSGGLLDQNSARDL